jgi:hypothetical protein
LPQRRSPPAPDPPRGPRSSPCRARDPIVAPSAGAPGLLAFQPTDPASFEPLDPIAIRYTATGGVVQPGGDPAPLLALTTPGTLLKLMVDSDERLWVGVSMQGGGTTFVVLATH